GAAVARFPDTEEVTGSIPVSRTIFDHRRHLARAGSNGDLAVECFSTALVRSQYRAQHHPTHESPRLTGAFLCPETVASGACPTLGAMTDPSSPMVPAGWYPDHDVPGGQRWWSGIEWTEYRTPPAAAPQYAAPQYAAPQYAYAPAATPIALPADAWPYVGQAAPVGTAVPLWAPLYGATMGQAWTRFWRKYADFSGRASRSEYWLAYLWFV